MRFAIPDRPFVSALVAVRDEQRTLARAVLSILRQDWPGNALEVLIVDGRSRDATREVAAALAARDTRVRLLDNPCRFVAAGLNRGLAEARGEVVLRVDGHASIPRGYLRDAVAALRGGAACAGGPVRARGVTPTARAIALAMSSPFGVGGATFRHVRPDAGPRNVDHLPFGVWPRALFDRVGAFDEALVHNQDDEFSDRIRRAGGRIVLLPHLAARYQSRATLAGVARQYTGYGWWKVQVIARRGGWPSSPRHVVPAVFVLALAASAVLLGTPWRALAALVPGAYAAFLALAVAHALRARGDRAAWRLSWVLPVMHAAYGLGFLAALGAPRERPRTSLREPSAQAEAA